MTCNRGRWIAAALVVASAVPLSADRVRLRSGKVLDGIFIGGDSKSVRVLRDDGTVSEARLEDVTAVEFDARTPTAPPPGARPPAATAPAAARPPAPPPVRVPSGTTINVRLTQAIDVDASKAGQTFKAVVDDPVTIAGATAIPRGASAELQTVQVTQSGTVKGADKITLKLASVGFGGQVYPVTSTVVESKGKGEGRRSARKIGGGAGLGALVGGIAGGGSGAAIGAAVGGVAGAAVAASGEEHLKLAAETRLQFQLNAAVNVRP